MTLPVLAGAYVVQSESPSFITALDRFPFGTVASIFGIIAFIGLSVWAWRWSTRRLLKVKSLRPIKAWAQRIGDQLDREKARHRRIEKFLSGWEGVAKTMASFSAEYRNPDAIYNAFEDITNREAKEYKKRLMVLIEEFRRNAGLSLEVTQYAVGTIATENKNVDNFFYNLSDGATKTSSTVKTEPQKKDASGTYTTVGAATVNTTGFDPQNEYFKPDPRRKYLVYFFTNTSNPQDPKIEVEYEADAAFIENLQTEKKMRYGRDFIVQIIPIK
jgi:hypothetical protein